MQPRSYSYQNLFLGIIGAGFLQAGYPSCRLTDVKALKG